MGFEPTTFCLEGRSSTTELHPHYGSAPPFIMEATRLRALVHADPPYPWSHNPKTAPPPASRRFPGQTSDVPGKTASK